MNKLRFLPSPAIRLVLWKQILSAEGIPGNGHPNNYIYEIFPTQAEVPNFVSQQKTQGHSNNAQLSAKDTYAIENYQIRR
jgi:hypothetical protein